MLRSQQWCLVNETVRLHLSFFKLLVAKIAASSTCSGHVTDV
jgi:hypothetical protein